MNITLFNSETRKTCNFPVKRVLRKDEETEIVFFRILNAEEISFLEMFWGTTIYAGDKTIKMDALTFAKAIYKMWP